MRFRRFLFIVCASLCALRPADLTAAPASTAKKPTSAKAPARAPARKPSAKPSAKTPSAAQGPKFSNAYASPRSVVRAVRKQTQYIILHTTEGARQGALEKLRDQGECHYVVDKGGVIYRIVDRKRVAYHCGVSMWNGVTDLDRYSIGIEIVGEHDHDLTAAQYASLKYLLADLKRIYKVPDDKILTHSMVAYGTPNRWQKRNHRGRKRCAMLLADPDRRLKMGILAKPTFDPDLKARRLVDADPELTRILYAKTKPTNAPAVKAPAQQAAKPATPASAPASNVIGPKRSAWDIARDLYNAPTTLYKFPNGTTKKGSDIRDWGMMPEGTVVTVGNENENATGGAGIVGRDSSSIRDLVGDEALAPTTFYIEPGAKTYRKGSSMTQAQVDALPGGTRALVQYSVAGPISARNRVYDICGMRWNRSDTYYLTPTGNFIPGDAINEKAIPQGAMVFFRK